MKPTLILGASSNPYRNSNQLTERLIREGHPVWPVGRSGGKIGEATILGAPPVLEPGTVDTVTVYLNAENQREYYDYVLALKPKRLIFNPGAENFELGSLAQKAGIQVEYRCSQVMMAVGLY
ncbi:MAG: CoA-binding protein [Bacteroidia bacterium]|nr:CoA-binding protein [Bacteroidia bacterium]